MKFKLKTILFYALHLIGFVILFLVVRDLNWEDFIREFKTVPAWKYATGIIILLFVYISKSYRWYLLNKSFQINTTWKDALVFYLSAGFLSVITPGRLGEFAKIYFLNRRYKTDIATSTSSVILDRIWDVLVLSSIAGISLVVLLFSEINLLTVVLIGVLFLFSLSIIILPDLFFKPLLYLTRSMKKINESIAKMSISWRENRFRYFTPCLLISLLAFLSLAFIPWLFSAGTDYPITYFAGVASISISNILSFIPITLAGFGTRELVFSEVWSTLDHPREVAISVSISYFMVTYLGSLIIGGIVYFFQLRNLYSIRDLRKSR